MKPFVALLAGVLALGVTAGARDAQTPDAKQIDAGKKIYETQKCATCHSIAGKGNKMFPLDGVGKKLSAADIKRWFTHTAEMEAKLPKPPTLKMSARKYDLKDPDIEALVAYMQSLK
jgi:mono/diheme cytochrome c family protein